MYHLVFVIQVYFSVSMQVMPGEYSLRECEALVEQWRKHSRDLPDESEIDTRAMLGYCVPAAGSGKALVPEDARGRR